MPGPAERVDAARGRSEAPTREGTVGGRDARRRARGVEGNRVRRPFNLRGLVLGHHLREREVRGDGGRDGRADEAAGVLDHEGHLFGRHVLGGDDEVAFVFARGRVQDDDEVATFFSRRGSKKGSTSGLSFFLFFLFLSLSFCGNMCSRRKKKIGDLARRTESFYRILHGIEREV